MILNGSWDLFGDDFDPFVVISVIGQEFLAINRPRQALSLLRLALQIGCPSAELMLSVLGAVSFAYYQLADYAKTIHYLELQLDVTAKIGKYFEIELFPTNSVLRLARYRFTSISCLLICNLQSREGLVNAQNIFCVFMSPS